MAEFCCTTLTLSLPKAAKVRKNQILISFSLMLKNKYSYCSTMWSTNSKVRTTSQESIHRALQAFSSAGENIMLG